jgi:uncharacterized membrane protein YkoI
MQKKITGLAVGVIALGGLGGVASAKPSHKAHHHRAAAAVASRMDDGKDLLPQAKITEQQAIAAAQRVASGDLNEVDLEHLDGVLVYTVDVGAKDVKVDATSGKVVDVAQDD